ncbi:MAG: DUF488 family protein [Proteobacteria bacterium]|nr:DUF488 family protein [Pseudomonadota bacterium]MBV1715939.1 DUF488 family protein [Desulfarculus sp.]MCG2763236.1 DUF488 family protein [Desulfarculaceae bacterium]MBU4567312.1 DUF488 family protein [Pseudomonadota bacterium]MBU4577078.1 DUF488 family protein [Pseudomonadota bacterium]
MANEWPRLKRIYDQAEPSDGKRYLVDRLWPRGVGKTEAKLDGWLKELAPSDELRKWYGHVPDRWGEFKRRYRLELKSKANNALLSKLALEQRKETITLLYAAKDREHNNAVVLREELLSKNHPTG